MTLLLTGTNDFEVHQALKVIESNFSGSPEHIDGSTVTINSIPDLLMGISLFAEERLVIIDQLSASSSVWSKLGDWLPRVSDTVKLVLIEPTLDKRTSTYKALKAAVEIKEFPAWTDRDATQAGAWVVHYAKDQGVDVPRAAAAHLVARIGVDQWQLSQAIAILQLAETDGPVTTTLINELIVPSLEENVFQLLEDALSGRAEDIPEVINSLKLTEDPHRLMALISSQIVSLAAVVLAPDDADPAKDFGVHPFVVSKLRRYRSSLGIAGALGMVKVTAQADADLKSSKAEPWVLVERLLMKLAYRDFA